MTYCSYYQATITKPEKTWFVVATLKSFDHLAFDRATDDNPHMFEFFVPKVREEEFLRVMKLLERQGVVGEVVEMENRLVRQCNE